MQSVVVVSDLSLARLVCIVEVQPLGGIERRAGAWRLGTTPAEPLPSDGHQACTDGCQGVLPPRQIRR